MPPELIRDWPMWDITPAGRREIDATALEMPAGDGQKASITQLLLNQEVMHVAPRSSLQNDFLLHELIADGPARRALDDVEVRTRAMARRIPNDALDVAAQLLRCYFLRDGHAQKSRGDHGNEPDGAQIDELEA